MTNMKLRIKRWETVCSDEQHLYFASISNTDKIVFTVTDTTYNYEFTFDGHCPYMVFDEALRSEHTVSDIAVGATFIYEDSDFLGLFNPGTMDVLFACKRVTHFAIYTDDAALEVLSDKEPSIRKYLQAIP